MGFRGGSRGGRGGRGGGRGGFRGPGKSFDQGPPEEVVEFGTFLHECEGQLVVKSIIDKVPFFNAPIYLKNIEPIGKVDEILGAINEYLVSIQLNENYKASSFEANQKLYIDPRKLLPLDRFIPKPPQPKESKKRKSNSDNRGVKKFRDDRGNNRGRGGFGSFSRGGRGGGGNNRDHGGFSRGGRGQGGGFGRGGGGGNRSGSFGRGGSRKF